VAAAADLAALEPQISAASPVRIRFVNEASGVLAQQIENGAPYDVFLSANVQFVDKLALNGKIDPASVRPYAVGRLGVVWRDGKHHSIKDLEASGVRFVALANPKLAPYGAAAVQAVEHAGMWRAVEPKVVYGENVRQALQLCESGSADAALTAASLLHGRVFDSIPDDWHQPIVQKAGIVAGGRNRALGEQFLAWLRSPAGQAIFREFGFGPAP